MTEQEKLALLKLKEAWNEFQKLSTIHPSDNHEFLSAIHICQLIIMARETVRNNQELFFSLQNLK